MARRAAGAGRPERGAGSPGTSSPRSPTDHPAGDGGERADAGVLARGASIRRWSWAALGASVTSRCHTGGVSQRVRTAVRVEGIVQGVGFRPFVYSLATSLGLGGLVGNDVDGVFAEVEGPP